MQLTKQLVLFISVCSISFNLLAIEQVFDSGHQQNRLIELFTSEGCSSCPPADQFLSRLQADPQLWSTWVPVALHVGYWDYLGWKDAFARPEHTEKQYAYRKNGRSKGVYTPGFFINGQEWRGFFNSNRMLPNYEAPPAGQLKVYLKKSQANISFQPLSRRTGSNNEQSGYLLHWAITGSDLSTQVKGGENARKTLEHDFVALASGTLNNYSLNNYSLNKHSLNKHSLNWQLAIPVLLQKSKQALSVWVSPVDDPQQVLQTTGGWLE